MVWAMPDLKKYLTEGLIQVAILLSLAGMRVDVDPYLPPFSEIILGPNSALTQTQFHNLQNILDGYNLHPKTADLDGFFTARRLLNWVRSLDHLQVPAAELEAWLVHGEPENGVSIPAQVGLLEEGGGLEDVEEPSELSMRLGNGGEVGYDVAEDQTLGALGLMSRSLNHPDDDDLLKEDMDTAETIADSSFNISDSDRNTGSMENFIHQDVSLHQATLPRSTEAQSSVTMEETCCINNHSMPNINLDNSTNAEAFEDSDIIDLLLTAGTSLPSPIDPLLEEAMLDEIGLMDLALVELSQAQSEDQNPADSDSGLSLYYSQSPASPSGSESSSSSSSSSCSFSLSSPTPSLMPEEGAVGYTNIKEEDEAVGEYMPEQSKMCQSSFLEARQFHRLPWLEHIGHDHTYNQPQSRKKPPKDLSDESPKNKVLEHLSCRDEKHARLLNLPFSNEHIINLPVDEFSRLLAKYHLNETQLTLIRDIRRRGKNKMAAQNCRRRKLDVLLGLGGSVDSLRCLRAKLLREKSEILRSIREMKQHLNSLYQEVYERLREEQGLLYSDNNFTLQQDSTRPVTSQRRSDSHPRRKLSKRQKHKK
ncbi:nuclear factor erythroid 2-related factor 1-like [Sinocyclocheilus grahami]|uniref:nuclear factor erythroid 2-related factor 1-like n=1 Tax=Sinocyclocheilus grahami TaxID=75366 RepID=UPI0007ACD725|nr:PREDICTED: nuclear factor erythroid 2-related factor 1-like [Sinocyclocheilus grahami]